MRLILQTLLILIIIATFSICAIQPDMHKNVIVYDSDYTLVTEEEVKTETKDIPIVDVPAKPIEKTTVVEKNLTPVTTTAKVQTNNVKKETQTTPKQTVTTKQTITKPQTKTESKPVTTAVTIPTVTETKKTEVPVPEQKVIIQKTEQPKVMTQQEETIAWNKWRSDIINSIMQDTKFPSIPQGTVFQFSFTVDKYGKITNVQTGANPANYTPYAIQYLAPVIRSYQGRSILNFPEGTARTSTQVQGKWRITDTAKYSTPQDFNDYEKVIRY